MLNGQVPEQVPHWMQLWSCPQPGTLMISFPNPLTLSPSYLIVRWIRIIKYALVSRGGPGATQFFPVIVSN